jgi:MoaA/NifB/PqqE/SkfB family radical SAM enzyme
MNLKYPWQLYHWHFEISSKCALRCPRCPRVNADPVPWVNKEISLDQFKSILDQEMLTTTVKRITFCGDLGDPIYNRDFLDIIRYIKTTNPRIHIYTITNGSYKSTEWWKEFASLSNEYDTINFSVDGFDHESNIKYRVNSDWNSIIDGMRIMAANSEAFVYWATIVFSFNQDHLDDIKQQATSIGCDGLQITHSTKFGSKYGDAYGGPSDQLEPRPEFISESHRYERNFIPLNERILPNSEYLIKNFHLFKEVSTQYSKFVTPMCLIGNRAVYVSADGTFHPCSWVSFPYASLHTDRKTIRFQDSFHQKNRHRLNLFTRSLQDILDDDIWDHLFKSFDDPSKAWVECEQKCHCSLVTEDYAVGWLTN